MTRTKGEPAFPIPGPIEGEFTRDRAYGLSILDYFAGQAMIALLSHPANHGETIYSAKFATSCYDLASAMVKEREKHANR